MFMVVVLVHHHVASWRLMLVFRENRCWMAGWLAALVEVWKKFKLSRASSSSSFPNSLMRIHFQFLDLDRRYPLNSHSATKNASIYHDCRLGGSVDQYNCGFPAKNAFKNALDFVIEGSNGVISDDE